jgi:hypothetical protein
MFTARPLTIIRSSWNSGMTVLSRPSVWRVNFTSSSQCRTMRICSTLKFRGMHHDLNRYSCVFFLIISIHAGPMKLTSTRSPHHFCIFLIRQCPCSGFQLICDADRHVRGDQEGRFKLSKASDVDAFLPGHFTCRLNAQHDAAGARAQLKILLAEHIHQLFHEDKKYNRIAFPPHSQRGAVDAA